MDNENKDEAATTAPPIAPAPGQVMDVQPPKDTQAPAPQPAAPQEPEEGVQGMNDVTVSDEGQLQAAGEQPQEETVTAPAVVPQEPTEPSPQQVFTPQEPVEEPAEAPEAGSDTEPEAVVTEEQPAAQAQEVADETPAATEEQTEDAPETPTADTPEASPMAITPKKSDHHSAPTTVVVLAIVVALALIGFSIFAYMQSNKETGSVNSTTSEQDKAGTTPATGTDIDDTNSSIDEALNATDAASELPEDELSDEALGL